jgi:tetratricopeptide (TPR) repeat protein
MKKLFSSEIHIQRLLFVLAFLVYANTLVNDFAWDDSIVITENPRIKKGISGIPDLFIKYNSQFKSDKYGYRPIVLVSYAIEYSLFKDNPMPGHFTNIFSFSLLVLVLYQLLRKLFPNYKNSFAFLVCLLFIAHPVHTEVVANIKSRDEIFALLFSFLAFIHFLNFKNQQKIKHLLYATTFFILAYLSKENAIVFLVIIPLSLFQNTKIADFKKNLSIIITLFLLGILSGLVLILYTNSGHGVESSFGAGIYYENGILGNSFFYTANLSGKLANAFCVLLLYLKNFLFPVTQLYYYGYNQIPVANWQQVTIILSLLIHMALLIICILFYKKNKVISFGIFFYFISISIYLHLFRTLADTMADRFLFTPSVGLCVLTVWLFGFIFKINFEKQTVIDLLNIAKDRQKKAFQPTFKFLFGCILILLSLKTISRNKVWKNNESLVTHDMPQLENCARANNYFADVLQNKLKNNYDATTETLMIKHYLKSIEISKASYYAFLGLGNYYKNIKKYNQALPVFDSMVHLFPEQADPHFFIGDTYLQLEEYQKAEKHLSKALALAPNVLSSYLSLSLTLSKLGKFDEAIKLLEHAKKLFGESLSISENFGIVYFEKGDLALSSKYTFQLINYGIDVQTVYKIVIGRYQFNKQDSMAALIYKEGIAKGVFR